MRNLSERVMAGMELYGDDFTPDEIDSWYKDEETAYFELAGATGGTSDKRARRYPYGAFNWFHAFRLLSRRRYGTCLAFGCADGLDVEPIAPYVDRFVAVEPAEQWWGGSIGGKPTRYLKPAPNGDLPLPDRSVDLITSLGVLHHVPNVSHVLAEFGRVLSVGGVVVLREPISNMGDWRLPRPGLTCHERGLPLRWLDEAVRATGFRYLRRRPCMFQGTYLLGRLIRRPFDRLWIVRMDWLVSRLSSWNDVYWRQKWWQKLAPTSAFVILHRPQC